MHYYADKTSQHKAIAELLKAKDPIKTIEKLIEDKTALEKKVEAYEHKELIAMAKELAVKVTPINGVHFVGLQVGVSSADALKKLALQLKLQLNNGFVLLTSIIDAKANIAIAIDDELAKSKDLDAGKIIKQNIAALIKGGGGGQKTLATAGGQDVSQLDQVIEAVKALL